MSHSNIAFFFQQSEGSEGNISVFAFSAWLFVLSHTRSVIMRDIPISLSIMLRNWMPICSKLHGKTYTYSLVLSIYWYNYFMIPRYQYHQITIWVSWYLSLSSWHASIQLPCQASLPVPASTFILIGFTFTHRPMKSHLQRHNWVCTRFIYNLSTIGNLLICQLTIYSIMHSLSLFVADVRYHLGATHSWLCQTIY